VKLPITKTFIYQNIANPNPNIADSNAVVIEVWSWYWEMVLQTYLADRVPTASMIQNIKEGSVYLYVGVTSRSTRCRAVDRPCHVTQSLPVSEMSTGTTDQTRAAETAV